jgi:NAD(P)-dependent dehydrogenase (short-subunit alcohol dehydrogenase family)
MQRAGEQRVLVVGASKGVGRAVGMGLAQEGARVAFAARSADAVREAARQAGEGATSVQMDVSDEDSVQAAVTAVVDTFGGLDVLVYAPALGPLRRLRNADAGVWRRVMDTNVIGASVVTRHVIDHLAKARGKAIYLSSIAEGGPPWPGLSLYATSKAALIRLVDSWRFEEPTVSFTRLVLGPISGMDVGSEFGADWDPELAVEMGTDWVTRRLHDGVTQIPAVDCVEYVIAIMRTSATLEQIVVQPRP